MYECSSNVAVRLWLFNRASKKDLTWVVPVYRDENQHIALPN